MYAYPALSGESISLASWKAPRVLLAAAILVISFMVYFNALFNGFVYDDTLQVLNNEWIKDPRYIPEIFSANVWGFRGELSNYYRPLMYVIYMASYRVFGLNPLGFHLVNILLHAAVTMLVFLLAQLLFEKDDARRSAFLSPPFVAAVLFATHPVHTEAVAWVGGLPEISFTFFYMLSLYLYIVYRKGRRLAYPISVVSFFTAALCKETALTLPVLFVAYDHIFMKEDARAWGSLKRVIPYLFVGAAYFLLRVNALGALLDVEEHWALTPWQWFLNIFPLLCGYIGKLLLPVNLSPVHVFRPIASLSDERAILSILALAAAAVLLYRTVRKNGVMLFGLLAMVVSILPCFYLPAMTEPFAERYLYLPSFGFALLLSMAFRAGKRTTAAVAVFLALVACLYSAQTMERNAVLKDDCSLWADALGKFTDGDDPAGLYNNLGVGYANGGRTDMAIEQFRTALSLRPNSAVVNFNLANAYKEKGLLDRAITFYKNAIRLQPSLADAHFGLASIYFKLGLIDLSIRHFEAAVRLNQANSDYRKTLDFVYALRTAARENSGKRF